MSALSMPLDRCLYPPWNQPQDLLLCPAEKPGFASLTNSPSHLHGRRQPSNRSDGSLGTKRGGGLCHFNADPHHLLKAVVGPKPIPSHLHNVRYAYNYMQFHSFQSSDLKTKAFCFLIRRNLFLNSVGPTSLLVRSY